MKKVDYIIVGNGLAAICLIWKLLNAGKKVCQVFHPEKPAASMVAAGMYNPLVFKRVTKSWRVDDFLPLMRSFYQELETGLGTSFFYSKDIIKFLAQDEYKRWKTKSSSGNFDSYIVKLSKEIPFQGVQDYFGYGQVTGPGYVDVGRLIAAMNSLSNNNYQIVKEVLDYDDIQLSNGRVRWKGFSAERMVFCEGAHAVNNPFFPEVPYYLSSGSLLEIQIENFQNQYILNKNIFLLPLGGSKYLTGSTYNWSDMNSTQKESDKEYLITKLSTLISVPYTVIRHRTGIRPSVKDRRPVLGIHSEISQLAYFNGLGTKGIILAPYFAEEMYQHLEQGIELSEEVRLMRFKDKSSAGNT